MSIFIPDVRDIRLTLNGFPLYGVDTYDCEWHVTFQDVDGLFDGVGSTLQTGEKAMTNGWYGNLPRLKGRVINITGHVIGSCTESCVQSWSAFKSVLDMAGMKLVVELGDIKRQVQVFQSSSAPLVKWNGVNILKFSVGLTALDPCLYGLDLESGSTGLPSSNGGMCLPYLFDGNPPHGGVPSSWGWGETVTSGRIRLTNPGTSSSPTFLRVDGPVWNPQILHVETGHVMAFSVSLGLGHYATVNGMTHEVLIDGTVPAGRYVSRRQFGNAMPGGNEWRFTADDYSAGARMTVSFYPAYM